MNTKAIYTAIIGDYDVLQDPAVVNEDWDYICFTNNPRLESKVWTIMMVDAVPDRSPSLTARNIKINSYDGLGKQYEIVIWADANIRQNCDLNNFLLHRMGDTPMAIMKHPRNCIYEEGRICIGCGKGDPEVIEKQLVRYDKEGYPRNNGLVASGVIIRRTDDLNVRNLMNAWWDEVKNGSIRDQLSFNYCLWGLAISEQDIPEITYLDYRQTIHKDFTYYSHKVK